MGRAWLTIVMACAAAGGCLNRGDRAPSASVARSLAPVQQTEGVFIESVILERPLGDRFLDRDLWALALPVGTPEMRVLQSENGLRVGMLSGTLPPKFQTLLESESEALNGRGLTFANRKEEVLPVSGPHERCEFGLLSDLAGKRETVTFAQARCGILVRPEPLSDHHVRVTCEPQIQHGERQDYFRGSADGTGWVKQDKVPLKSFQQLAFDVSLGRNEYLIIGCHAGQPDALGAALFEAEANGQPRQRVLVIRARQLSASNSSDLPPLGTNGRRLPVAAEAGRPR